MFTEAFGDDRLRDLHYETLGLGERTQKDISAVNSQFLDPEYADEYFFKNNLHDSITKEVDYLLKEWVGNIQKNKNCPNIVYIQHRDYFNYLFRLISINYLFESLITARELEINLGYKSHECSLKWKDLFSQCRPKSADMKKYLGRLNNRHLKGLNFHELSKVRRSDLDKFIANLKSNSSEIQGRLINDLNCSDKCSESSQSNLKSNCSELKKQVLNLCNESDHYYGLSIFGQMLPIIAGSSALENINSRREKISCLKKFQSIHKDSEDIPVYIPKLFESALQRISKKSDEVGIEGRIYTHGALKYFDDLGLGNIVFNEVKKKKVIKPVTVKKFIEKPPVNVKKKVVERVAKIIKPKLVKKKKELSAFESAVKILNKDNLKRVSVDMIKLIEDYPLSQRILSKISKPLKIYQTRKALEDMKSFDKLGTKEQPIRLLFLKYLIDFEQHQGLYNITSVIGDSFFALNDIEKKKSPVKVEIKNDETTNYMWQIYILKND